MSATTSRDDVSFRSGGRWNASISTQYVDRAQDGPPTPPPKDTPSTPRTPNPDSTAPSHDMSSYFRPGHLSRAGSVYSLSRVSFTSQISRLTAVHLPEAGSLKGSISAISTAPVAARTLIEAATKIQAWIQKASDVMGGLDAGDDVEWAAAAGRDGLGEINQAIDRFEELVQVYVSSVEELQLRTDAGLIPPPDMKHLVDQVEKVTAEWRRIKKAFGDIKLQVELAIEWEELENVFLGDISNDLDELSRVVFEMEERRHHLAPEPLVPADGPLDIEELETIVHEAPRKPKNTASLETRFSTELNIHHPQQQSPELSSEPAESSLIGLFARMQPLRAALDFLPMRLSTFRGRAIDIFPSACDQLSQRRDGMEQRWQQLDADADSLRKELGEDRWNLVFRNAGKQAMKLIDSVERSLIKVDESLGNNTQLKHASSTLKKIENYHAKKQHYCPAIDRVLSIVDRGVKDRLTVNGEIVRLRSDLRQRWQSLQREMKHIDSLLEEYASDIGSSHQQQQLRDSLSSIMSNERSLTNSVLATPGSSPPSSVVSRKGSSHDLPSLSPSKSPKAQIDQPLSTTSPAAASGEYLNSKPSPSGNVTPTKGPVPHQSYTPQGAQKPTRNLSTPLKTTPRVTPKSSTQPDRPRWSYSKSSTSDYNVSDYYKSLMSKGSSAHKPASRQSSINSVTSGSSPLGNRLTTPQSSTSRPSLNRKTSNLSNTSTQQPKPRSTSTTRPAASSHIAKPQDTPLSIQKRGATSTASPSSQTNPRASPSPYMSSASASHFISPTSSPRTSIMAGTGPRSRRSSHIPVPVDRSKIIPSSPASHASLDIGSPEDVPPRPLE